MKGQNGLALSVLASGTGRKWFSLVGAQWGSPMDCTVGSGLMRGSFIVLKFCVFITGCRGSSKCERDQVVPDLIHKTESSEGVSRMNATRKAYAHVKLDAFNCKHHSGMAWCQLAESADQNQHASKPQDEQLSNQPSNSITQWGRDGLAVPEKAQ